MPFVPFVYIDQNVLGFQLDGKINFSGISGLRFVYSKVHFAEIRRSQNPESYLRALRDIGATLLELQMDNFKFTGSATLVEEGFPEEHYSRYMESIGEVNFDEGIFDPFQVWVNGGGNADLLRSLPNRFLAQLQTLNEYLPEDLRLCKEHISDVMFSDTLEQMIADGNDVENKRAALGGMKGRFGSIKGENQILQIWKIIKPFLPSCSNLTSDHFFGFEPIPGIENEPVSIYLGIVRCCAVLDILGFKAEKKSRRIEKIANVRSDAAHIGMAAFCQALLSSDRRLTERAKAIYQYKGIGTVPLILEDAS